MKSRQKQDIFYGGQDTIIGLFKINEINKNPLL